MEDFYNQTSAYSVTKHTYTPTDTDYYISSHTDYYDYYYDYDEHYFESYDHWEKNIELITHCLIFSAAMLGLCLVVYGLYGLVKTGKHFSQVFVINLFIADLIQTCDNLIKCFFIFLTDEHSLSEKTLNSIFYIIYLISLMANICFMVFISAERYVMIAHPVWYRNIHTIRTSVFVSVTVWIVLPTLALILFLKSIYHVVLFQLLILLLPYPLMMLFFMGTWRALSRNTSLSRHEQRRIMRTLALVFSIYTVLFLPFVMMRIMFFKMRSGDMTPVQIFLANFTVFIIALHPLFDFLLYLLMRRDAKDILKALLFFFCKRPEDDRVTETTENQV